MKKLIVILSLLFMASGCACHSDTCQRAYDKAFKNTLKKRIISNCIKDVRQKEGTQEEVEKYCNCTASYLIDNRSSSEIKKLTDAQMNEASDYCNKK